MFFQRVVKGIHSISDKEALQILKETGIWSNLSRKKQTRYPDDADSRLTIRNVEWHLSRYDDIDPNTGVEFHRNTPFISTSAGVVERDEANAINVTFSALETALRFATQTYTTEGFVFYGYVYTLGKQSVELAEFAEEVRELNIYRDYLPWHAEGEILAKIHIPPTRLEKVEWYRPDGDLIHSFPNDQTYEDPERFLNLREYISSA